jgi:alpha-L-fucosidase 2
MKYTIEQNIAGNGFIMYNGHSKPFQIDANFGFVGAALSFLVVDNPLEDGSEKGRVVVLGPAIPTSWSPGEVKGLRLRGGGTLDFQWDATGTVAGAHVTGRTASIILVNKAGKVL